MSHLGHRMPVMLQGEQIKFASKINDSASYDSSAQYDISLTFIQV